MMNLAITLERTGKPSVVCPRVLSITHVETKNVESAVQSEALICNGKTFHESEEIKTVTICMPSGLTKIHLLLVCTEDRKSMHATHYSLRGFALEESLMREAGKAFVREHLYGRPNCEYACPGDHPIGEYVGIHCPKECETEFLVSFKKRNMVKIEAGDLVMSEIRRGKYNIPYQRDKKRKRPL